MKKENAYDFRKKMVALHTPDRRVRKQISRNDQFLCEDGLVILIDSYENEVIRTAAEDLRVYLKVSMGVDVTLDSCPVEVGSIRVSFDTIKDASQKDGFTITTDQKGIRIVGDTARGAAQGVYYLEDMMTFEGAPAVSYGVVHREPMFSPRMVHSGYGLDDYPDEYLAAIAHEGRDAILVFVEDVDTTPSGYLDFNDLVRRAGRYGLDVYAYSYLVSDMSPEAEEAELYYENTYGRLFRECPGLRGVTLVGESVEFPSKDPHVARGRRADANIDGIPTGKPSSGWYPCEDYPQWLNLIKRVIRKYNREADIVFWTYNWGYQPEEARVRLIESLPTDISLLVTFEMFEATKFKETTGICADYTLSFAGPGAYFASEAKAASKRGIRLYSMTNTGGLTWDFGVIPYEPMPHQWIRRYQAIRQANRDRGLCGLMETHHYGMYPSFISKLSKWVFLEPYGTDEEILCKILGAWFGRKNVQKVDKGLQFFSEAIRNYVPSTADQYGAFRVGPAYPFCLEAIIKIPDSKEAMSGSKICYPVYADWLQRKSTLLSLRIGEEIESLRSMKEYLEEGLKVLTDIECPNKNLQELINLGYFMRNTVVTGIHAKQWHVLKCHMRAETDREVLEKILDDMERLLQEELQNAEETISLVEQDSRLGWEPSMLYVGDAWHVEWKIRQVKYVLDYELKRYRESLKI